jgi:hypothetical protein
MQNKRSKVSNKDAMFITSPRQCKYTKLFVMMVIVSLPSIYHLTPYFQLWETRSKDKGFHGASDRLHATEREKIAIMWYNDVISSVYGVSARELGAFR